MNTVVVNLLGGPGTGKSTLAADLFIHCKKAGNGRAVRRRKDGSLIDEWMACFLRFHRFPVYPLPADGDRLDHIMSIVEPRVRKTLKAAA